MKEHFTFYKKEWKSILVIAGMLFLIINVVFELLLGPLQDNLGQTILTAGAELQEAATRQEILPLKTLLENNGSALAIGFVLLLPALFIAIALTLTILSWLTAKTHKQKFVVYPTRILLSTLKIWLLVIVARAVLTILNIVLLTKILSSQVIGVTFTIVSELVFIGYLTYALLQQQNILYKKKISFKKYSIIFGIITTLSIVAWVISQIIGAVNTTAGYIVSAILLLFILTIATIQSAKP